MGIGRARLDRGWGGEGSFFCNCLWRRHQLFACVCAVFGLATADGKKMSEGGRKR